MAPHALANECKGSAADLAKSSRERELHFAVQD
jgi:hypothetical protein